MSLARSCPVNSWQSSALPVSILHLSFNRESNVKIDAGAGKTTLLNFLSGREISKDLNKDGIIKVNG